MRNGAARRTTRTVVRSPSRDTVAGKAGGAAPSNPAGSTSALAVAALDAGAKAVWAEAVDVDASRHTGNHKRRKVMMEHVILPPIPGLQRIRGMTPGPAAARSSIPSIYRAT